MSSGFVYVLSNKCMPKLIKVGFTTRLPQDRANELSQTTGVPVPFKVEFAAWAENASQIEREFHYAFGSMRPNNSREFFYISIDSAREYLLFRILNQAPLEMFS